MLAQFHLRSTDDEQIIVLLHCTYLRTVSKLNQRLIFSPDLNKVMIILYVNSEEKANKLYSFFNPNQTSIFLKPIIPGQITLESQCSILFCFVKNTLQSGVIHEKKIKMVLSDPRPPHWSSQLSFLLTVFLQSFCQLYLYYSPA